METKKKVEEYKDKVKAEAEDLVLNKFPQKIMELETLIMNQKKVTPDMSAVAVDLNIPVPDPFFKNHETNEQLNKKRKFVALDNDVPGTKVLVLPNGVAPTNKHINEMVDVVKPKVRQLVEEANLLKMWVQFLIPRIEDGNNFGVSIQEDTLNEIRTVESEAGAYIDQISRYYLTRGKVVAKVAKYPHVEDFRRTVQELDEKEYLSLSLVLCEMRNHYASLHDVITKNLEKIRKPRSSNAESMY